MKQLLSESLMLLERRVCLLLTCRAHALCLERAQAQQQRPSTGKKEWEVREKVAQLFPTLCDPMDHTVHGILQARMLEWVAAPFSRGSSQPRD